MNGYAKDEYLKSLKIICKHVPGYYKMTGKDRIYPDWEYEDMRERLPDYIWQDVLNDIEDNFDKSKYPNIMDAICDMVNDCILYKVEMIEDEDNEAQDILGDILLYDTLESTLLFILIQLKGEIDHD